MQQFYIRGDFKDVTTFALLNRIVVNTFIYIGK